MVRVFRPAAFLATLLGVMITLPGFSVGQQQHQQQNPPPRHQEMQQAVVPADIGGLVSTFSSFLHDCGTIIAIPVLFKIISSSIVVDVFTSCSC
jgi:hypothetical protein